MTYYVLLYENYCITVPSSWVDIDLSIFRMPKKQLKQACLKQINPSNDWNEIAFKRKFGPFDSYNSARDVEKTVSELSASDDNLILPENNNSSKRLIKKRTFFGDTSSEEGDRKRSNISLSIPSNYIPQVESEHSLKSQSQQISKSISFIKPACGSKISKQQDTSKSNFDKTFQSLMDDLEDDKSDRWESVTNSDEEQEKETLEETLEETMEETLESRVCPQAINEGRSKAQPQIISNIRIQPRIKNGPRHNCEPDDPRSEPGERSEPGASTGNHRSCCDACRREVMQKFAIIERKLNFITQLMENPGREANPMIQNEDFSLLPNFPLTTVEQLKDFNQQLRSTAVRQQFHKSQRTNETINQHRGKATTIKSIQKMSKIGGENITKTVRNIMSECIGHEVAQVYTWTGQKKKPALKDCEISSAIIEMVIKKHGGTTTISQIEGDIKEWLRRAGDRLRSLLNKQ